MPLTVADTVSVYDLYRRVILKCPSGFLAEKSVDDFRAIFDTQEPLASVGAWVNERLVAYSLCALEKKNLFLGSPLLRVVQRLGEPLWSGKGTIVDPQFEGRLLMARLLARRYAMMQEHSALCHSAGLISVDNIPSLAGASRAGSLVVGLEDDQYCRNFVCYGGSITERITFDDQCTIALEDLSSLADKFNNSWVGTRVSFDRKAEKQTLILRRASIAGKKLR